jgi:hypothetical protein
MSGVEMQTINGAINELKRFVVEFVDCDTGCVCDEFVIEAADVAGLSSIVNPGGEGIHPAGTYDLTRRSLDELGKRYEILFENACGDARLRSWRVTDELPYKVHTNRELWLMLKGEKPLAVFSERLPSNPDFELIPERFFAPHVEKGLFLVFEGAITDARGAQTRFVFYAKKGEEWRIEAYMLLKRTAIFSGWSEGFERMEGSLLGYEDWQNDAYIEIVFNGRCHGLSCRG